MFSTVIGDDGRWSMDVGDAMTITAMHCRPSAEEPEARNQTNNEFGHRTVQELVGYFASRSN